MVNSLYSTEFADNPDPRLGVSMILDTSKSMEENDKIGALVRAMQQLKADIMADPIASLRVELSLVSFNHETQFRDFCNIGDFEPPYLEASGGTRIAKAVNTALDLLDQRKRVYKAAGISYYRPFAMLLTDGRPEHDTAEELAMVKERIAMEEAGRHVAFFAFGVEGADMNALRQITPPNRGPRLIGGVENIAGLFEWLSRSTQQAAHTSPGEPLTLDPIDRYLSY